MVPDALGILRGRHHARLKCYRSVMKPERFGDLNRVCVFHQVRLAEGDPGVSLIAPVHLPASRPFFATGLAALGVMKRRKI